MRAVAQPHCHHHAVMGWHTDSALLARAGAEVTAVGGCCGLAGNFGVERGHYEVSRAVAETALLPAVREAKGAVVLADGFSCRTQLDQLAHVSGIASGPAPGQPPGRRPAAEPGYLTAWTWVVWATRRSSESYTLVWAVTVVRPRCTGTATARTVPPLTGRNM